MGLLPIGTGDWVEFEMRGQVSCSFARVPVILTDRNFSLLKYRSISVLARPLIVVIIINIR